MVDRNDIQVSSLLQSNIGPTFVDGKDEDDGIDGFIIGLMFITTNGRCLPLFLDIIRGTLTLKSL